MRLRTKTLIATPADSDEILVEILLEREFNSDEFAIFIKSAVVEDIIKKYSSGETKQSRKWGGSYYMFTNELPPIRTPGVTFDRYGGNLLLPDDTGRLTSIQNMSMFRATGLSEGKTFTFSEKVSPDELVNWGKAAERTLTDLYALAEPVNMKIYLLAEVA